MIYALIAVVVLALWGIMLFNRGVRLKNQVEEAWSGISVQLKRRYDLIPNLVNTVKGYAAHEQDTLEKVIQLRNQAQSVPAGQINDQVQAEAALSAGVRSIFALAENYPDLKANQNFLGLQQTLTEVEDHLQNARRYYNAVVRDNNNYVDGFPSMIVARMGGFKGFDFFEADEKERGNVEVKF
ncbi:MAG: LemA family protein [Haliscomenobacter sp.]|nr:LemA family protein [Haliscomenobacter sp.]MBK8654201.1 LemA family protein [Haliscomenobacter sp.]MBP9075952.1 LemA family protein [Haliscomenobacter sp.]